ncbi:NADH-quinone oxidoreductase subunit NuoE [Alloiococcus sp. CFN-8]|uniref:NADH-quinone oxidoreductase subunit NuoE n=1 Tax=Alloiococcus sp. CFN-8 TaxID=3416081 RepID=UPI003CF8E5E6
MSTECKFNGTAQQEKELMDVIAQYKNEQGALMPIMQRAQDIYGYLPIEVQEVIADNLNIPLSQVYGVATFYSQFALKPKGKYKIGVCMGTACYVKGSAKVLEKIQDTLGIGMKETTEDGLFSIEDTRCLGCCGLAPVMMINDDVYGMVTPEQVGGILDKYRKESQK